MSTKPVHYEKDKILNPNIGDIVETETGELARVIDSDMSAEFDRLNERITFHRWYMVMMLDDESLMFKVPAVYQPSTHMMGDEEFVINGSFSELFD